LNWVYQTYPAANIEYAGTVYLGPKGFIATNPNPGLSDNSTPSLPSGGWSDAFAIFHTHGQCTPGMNGGNDVFSGEIPQRQIFIGLARSAELS
jgi:hypothetical protein